MTKTKPVAIVTGASSGIGAATARMLADNGYHVVAAARRREQLEPLRSDSVEPVVLDVTDSASICDVVRQVLADKGRIDVLINNAGYGGYGIIEGMPLEEARRQFNVNVFGAIDMIQAVLPAMRNQRAGRIVQLSSIVAHISLPATGWYSASKHAIKALMDALRLEVKPFGIDVIMIEPGAIDTGFEEIAIESLERSLAPEAYQPLIENFRRLIRREYSKAPGPDIVVRKIQQALATRRPSATYTDRLSTKAGKMARHLLGDRIFDRILERQLK